MLYLPFTKLFGSLPNEKFLAFVNSSLIITFLVERILQNGSLVLYAMDIGLPQSIFLRSVEDFQKILD